MTFYMRICTHLYLPPAANCMVSSADNINRGSDDPRLAFEGGGGVRFGGVAGDKVFALLTWASVSVNGRHCLTFLTSFCNT